jgi:hypothetical protein
VSARFTYFLLFLLCSLSSWAQDTSYNARVAPRYRTEYQFEVSGNEYKNVIDTGIDRMEMYNPVVQKYRLYQDLGNIGSPVLPLIFSQGSSTSFRLGNETMNHYYLTSEEVRYYQVKRPFTSFDYVQGAKELLFLKALHTQNITPRWNAGVNFRRIASSGYYTNQYNSLWSTQLFSSYRSKNQKYVGLTSINWNKGFLEMNGGITSDSAFEALSGVNKQVEVNLLGTSATGGGGPRNYFRNTTLQHKSFYYFGERKEVINGKDTLQQLESKAWLGHTIKTERFSYLYKDSKLPNKDYYPTFNFDTLATYDSLHFFNTENTFTFSNRGVVQKRLELTANFTHQYFEVAQRGNNSVYQNTFVSGRIAFAPLNSFRLFTDVSYGTSGYNAGDYLASAIGVLTLKPVVINVQGSINAREQSFVSQHFVSNHYLWYNTFDKTTTTHGRFSISSRNWRNNGTLSIKYYSIDQLVYYSSNSTPVQNNQPVELLVAELNKTFQWGNFFFTNQLYAQHVSDKKVMRLPELAAFQRFYYQKRLFKVMLTQIGFDIFYNSSFYANTFNPVTRQFQLQDSVKIGNYPVVDVFANAQIKKAAIFFKMEHVNADLSGNAYYSSPHQPMGHRSFRFGLTWRMYD